MTEGYLAYFDQFRYITGVMGSLVIFCHGILPPKPHYRLRLLFCTLFALAAAFFRVPLWKAISVFGTPYALIPYWLFMSFLPLAIILICYETNFAGAMLRTMMSAYVDNFCTILVYHLFVICLFPGYPQAHPLLYSLFVIITYAGLLTLAWYLPRSLMRTDESSYYSNPRKTGMSYLASYLIYFLIVSAGKDFCENLVLPLANEPQFHRLYSWLIWFMVLFLIAVSVAMSTILLSAYSMLTLRSEQQALRQILHERESQYEFSRENIEMINRKAHDLKHQIRALEQVSDEERRQQLRQTRKAIDFYDAVVKTGNEALDTLLTEKSVYCSNRNIRLSCVVNTVLLEKIGLVDLYTLLGNAIDNAIDGVDKLEEGKRLISLTIRDQGKMVYIQVDNYYDGELEMDEGLPLTTKPDKTSHGYGLKSMQMIIEKYKGTMQINTEGQVFSLQILIPLN